MTCEPSKVLESFEFLGHIFFSFFCQNGNLTYSLLFKPRDYETLMLMLSLSCD